MIFPRFSVWFQRVPEDGIIDLGFIHGKFINFKKITNQSKSCGILPADTTCEDNPCFNDVVCVASTNSLFKYMCQQDWTGEQCEIPLHSCVKNRLD